MTAIYDRQLRDIIKTVAEENGIGLQEGIYLQLSGPSFESPAEVCMARMLGADAVGMSTAVEAITARHMGMRVCGISCVCNLAAGMPPNPLSHEEVQEAAAKAAPLFTNLLIKSITRF